MAEKAAIPMASEKTLKLLGKIKKGQWKAMGETVSDMKEFAESGGVGLLGDLEESLTLKVEEMLSPIKNEVITAVNTALEPFMPFITTAINEATTYMSRGMGYLTALLTGNLDTWMAKETLKLQKEIDTWPDEWKNLQTQLMKIRHDFDNWLKGVGSVWSDFWRKMGWG